MLELLPRAYAPGGTHRPEGVVHPEPAIGQALDLSHRNAKLSVENIISEPAVE